MKYQDGQAAQEAVDVTLHNQKAVLGECNEILKKLKLESKPDLKYFQTNPYEKIAKENMEMASKQAAKYANYKRAPRTIKEGDMVLISTKDLDTSSYTSRACRALSPRYIGPYLVQKAITETSFRLRLPGHSTLHPVFHVSKLVPYKTPEKEVKAFTGFIPKLQDIPIKEIRDRKVQQGLTYYLVQWNNQEEHWVPARNLESAHQLIIQWEDQL